MEGHFAQAAEQFGELALAVQVDTVAGDVLRDDDDLLHAAIGKLLCLGEDILHLAGAVFAAKGGNDAVSAVVIAALGNAQKSVVLGGGHHAGQLLHRGVDAVEIRGGLPCCHSVDGLYDAAVAAGAENAIHLGKLREDLVLIALGKAARHEDLAHLTSTFKLRHLQNGVDGLAFGAVDKTAGVDDHHIGTGLVLLQLHARIAAQGHHLLHIHEILGTAKRNKRNLHMYSLFYSSISSPSAFSTGRMSCQSNPRRSRVLPSFRRSSKSRLLPLYLAAR